MEDVEHYNYAPPVAQFLSAGEPDVIEAEEWPNYVEQGLKAEHIPDLIHMATQEKLITLHPEDPRAWAPVYAWRALGQLHAEAASEPLLALFELEEGDNTWVGEELPAVYGMIGVAALPALTAYMAERSHGEHPRLHAVDGVAMIGKNSPDARLASIEILSQQLESFQPEEYVLNGNLIYSLVSLEAKEAAPLIQKVFEADALETFLTGDWEDVQERLSLLTPEQLEELHQRREAVSRQQQEAFGAIRRPATLVAAPSDKYWRQTPRDPAAKKEKRKDKLSKQARKKNRKR